MPGKLFTFDYLKKQTPKPSFLYPSKPLVETLNVQKHFWALEPYRHQTLPLLNSGFEGAKRKEDRDRVTTIIIDLKLSSPDISPTLHRGM